jgi:uncharacterized protein involved in outer membrane biogenesis
MKKILIRILIGILALIVVVALAVHFFLDGAIKRGVETVGPRLTQTDVKLKSINISILSGFGSIKELVIGNPEGYKSPSAINVGKINLSLQPTSLLSKKMVVKSISIDAAEVSFEGNPLGENNLKKIRENVEATSSAVNTNAPSTPVEKKASKKIEVDDFLMTATKVHVSLNIVGRQASGTLSVPEIHLTGLGKDSDGITTAELTKKIVQAIESDVVKTVASQAGNLGKGTADLTKGLGTTTTNSLNKATKSIGDIFKKKN